MSNTDTVHPALRTNAALVALAQAVAAGKGVSIPLHMEQGFVILTPDNSDVKYTKAQASKMLATCRTQAIGATGYTDTLPTSIKACLALTHNGMPAWAKGLNASTSRYSDAGKTIRQARDAAKIAATGGWVCRGVVGPSKRKTASAAIRAEHGGGWHKLPNADALRAEFRAETVMVKDAQAAPAPAPAPVAEAPTATVMDAQVVTVAQAMGSKATTPVGARKFLASRGINL